MCVGVSVNRKHKIYQQNSNITIFVHSAQKAHMCMSSKHLPNRFQCIGIPVNIVVKRTTVLIKQEPVKTSLNSIDSIQNKELKVHGQMAKHSNSAWLTVS